MGVQDWWSEGKNNPDSNAATPARKATWLVVAAIFTLCVAPTFISYQPYSFQWDDSDYYARAIAVSLAFWSENLNALGSFMISHHPPAMTLMGVPWGPLRSWNAAGKCFVTLAALISLLAATVLYEILRIGVRPLLSGAASVCVLASLGPFPSGSSIHADSTAFMADSLFAWAAVAAVLLLPYEARMDCPTAKAAVLRGFFWGLILSLGTMTKLSFLYFVALIVPLLFLMRFRCNGLRIALTAVVACACCLLPMALYFLRWGRYSIDLAKTSAFGGIAGFYYLPLMQYLGSSIRESPGLILFLLFAVSTLAYLAIRVIRRRPLDSWFDLVAILIMIGYTIIVLASPNREFRFVFPAIIGLPFLIAISLSGARFSVPRRTGATLAGLAFCGMFLASIPAQHRPDWRHLSRCNAVWAEVARVNAGDVLLATDSPTLNSQLMGLAGLFSSKPAKVYTLAYQAAYGKSIQDDFRLVSSADIVVFQDRPALNPPFTNQRVEEYESYVRKVGFGPIRVAEDVSVYLMH